MRFNWGEMTMHHEIERKYKVVGDDYQTLASEVWHIRQGYLCRDKGRTIRVRESKVQSLKSKVLSPSISPEGGESVQGVHSILNIKGPAKGISRFEYEHEVPAEVGEELFAMCLPGVIEKDRYIVPWENGLKIEVDVFHGKLEGLIFAEIEFESEEQQVTLPAWLGADITSDPQYSNAYLSAKMAEE